MPAPVDVKRQVADVIGTAPAPESVEGALRTVPTSLGSVTARAAIVGFG